jgi:hypothetical protein
LIISSRHLAIKWNPWRVFALVPLMAGISILVRCIWDFAVSGRGYSGAC